MTENFVKILDLKISCLSYTDTLELIKKWLGKKEGFKFVVTPNPEFLVKSRKNDEFKRVLNSADLAIPDGSRLVWASGGKIKERVSGTDLMVSICGVCEKEALTVGLIGGAEKIADRTGECLRRKYPRLKVKVFKIGYLSNLNKTKEKFDGVDVLFVALGMGKQEKWIWENQEDLKKEGVRLAMGVGGAFDYISGAVPRAPKWMRETGFEWLFRLIRQPWRLRRQLALPEFVKMIYAEKKGKLDFGVVPFVFRALFGK